MFIHFVEALLVSALFLFVSTSAKADLVQDSQCPEVVYGDVNHGYIYSPNYPDDYPDGVECTYTIKVSSYP
jgi:hypothetical protein